MSGGWRRCSTGGETLLDIAEDLLDHAPFRIKLQLSHVVAEMYPWADKQREQIATYRKYAAECEALAVRIGHLDPGCWPSLESAAGVTRTDCAGN